MLKESIDLENYVPALVTLLANKLSAGASAYYRVHFGIGVAEWRLLALLASQDNITANSVCNAIGLDKAAVSRAIKKAETAGYVYVTKDTKDTRQSFINLTEEGKELHAKVMKVALKREAKLLENISTSEREMLIEILHKLNKQVVIVNSDLQI